MILQCTSDSLLSIPDYDENKNNKNGVLWSQTRMRIEMRLRCFLVIQ